MIESVDKLVNQIFSLTANPDVLGECIARAAAMNNIVSDGARLKRIEWHSQDTECGISGQYDFNPCGNLELIEDVERVLNRNLSRDAHFTMLSICFKRLAVKKEWCHHRDRYNLIFDSNHSEGSGQDS